MYLHRKIHQVYSNDELAHLYNDIDSLREVLREDGLITDNFK